MFRLEDEFDKMFFGDENPKVKAKKKLNAYYDLYGEDKMKLEDVLDGEDYYDYLMASGFADEVLAERRQKREAEEKGMLRENQEERKKQNIVDEHSQINNSENVNYLKDAEQISDTGRMLIEIYKNMDKEKIGAHTDKYVKQTMEEIKEIKRRREVEAERSTMEVKGVKKMLPATKFAEDEEFNKLLGAFEGNYDFPYLDTDNIYTIGEGLNINSIFYDLPWVDKNGKPITDINILKREKAKLDKIYLAQEEIKKKYSKAEVGKYMRRAESFKDVSILRLPASFLYEVKLQRIREMEAELQVDIDNYNKKYSSMHGRKILDLDVMPREYAKVLLELKYNMGGGKFNPNKFPQLFDGLIRGDKDKILKNIHRIENTANDKRRNDWSKKLLRGVSKLPSVHIKTQIPDNVA